MLWLFNLAINTYYIVKDQPTEINVKDDFIINLSQNAYSNLLVCHGSDDDCIFDLDIYKFKRAKIVSKTAQYLFKGKGIDKEVTFTCTWNFFEDSLALIDPLPGDYVINTSVSDIRFISLNKMNIYYNQRKVKIIEYKNIGPKTVKFKVVQNALQNQVTTTPAFYGNYESEFKRDTDFSIIFTDAMFNKIITCQISNSRKITIYNDVKSNYIFYLYFQDISGFNSNEIQLTNFVEWKNYTITCNGQQTLRFNLFSSFFYNNNIGCLFKNYIARDFIIDRKPKNYDVFVYNEIPFQIEDVSYKANTFYELPMKFIGSKWIFPKMFPKNPADTIPSKVEVFSTTQEPVTDDPMPEPSPNEFKWYTIGLFTHNFDTVKFSTIVFDFYDTNIITNHKNFVDEGGNDLKLFYPIGSKIRFKAKNSQKNLMKGFQISIDENLSTAILINYFGKNVYITAEKTSLIFISSIKTDLFMNSEYPVGIYIDQAQSDQGGSWSNYNYFQMQTSRQQTIGLTYIKKSKKTDNIENDEFSGIFYPPHRRNSEPTIEDFNPLFESMTLNLPFGKYNVWPIYDGIEVNCSADTGLIIKSANLYDIYFFKQEKLQYLRFTSNFTLLYFQTNKLIESAFKYSNKLSVKSQYFVAIPYNFYSYAPYALLFQTNEINIYGNEQVKIYDIFTGNQDPCPSKLGAEMGVAIIILYRQKNGIKYTCICGSSYSVKSILSDGRNWPVL